MQASRLGIVIAATLAVGAAALPVNAQETDLGRETLPENDGWASAGSGTTGGSAATGDNVFHVESWDELRQALGGDAARGNTTDRIVYVHGTIDADATPDVDGAPDCGAYADEDWDFDAYLDTFDDDGQPRPEADEQREDLEAARASSHENQSDQVVQNIGSNVTIVGVGDDARIRHASLALQDSENVIIRNLEISDAYDCFPSWDPGDFGGTWNSEFDNLWIGHDSRNVWVDHVSLNDGDNPPGSLPEYFGSRFEVHDGLLDITNGADLVTVSWNRITDHDKVMLIGNSDSRTTDRGKLRVTLHHNLFQNTGQRTPRVRFGQVHVYNNYYDETNQGGFYEYNWGAGKEGQIFAEKNFFRLAPEIEPADVIYNWGGTALEAHQSFVSLDGSRARNVDLVRVHNANHPEDEALDDKVSWKPRYVDEVHAPTRVPAAVTENAGAGRIG